MQCGDNWEPPPHLTIIQGNKLICCPNVPENWTNLSISTIVCQLYIFHGKSRCWVLIYRVFSSIKLWWQCFPYGEANMQAITGSKKTLLFSYQAECTCDSTRIGHTSKSLFAKRIVLHGAWQTNNSSDRNNILYNTVVTLAILWHYDSHGL